MRYHSEWNSNIFRITFIISENWEETTGMEKFGWTIVDQNLSLFFLSQSILFPRIGLSTQSTSPFRPRDTTPQESVAAPLHAGVKMAAASRLHPG